MAACFLCSYVYNQFSLLCSCCYVHTLRSLDIQFCIFLLRCFCKRIRSIHRWETFRQDHFNSSSTFLFFIVQCEQSASFSLQGSFKNVFFVLAFMFRLQNGRIRNCLQRRNKQRKFMRCFVVQESLDGEMMHLKFQTLFVFIVRSKHSVNQIQLLCALYFINILN